MTSSIDHNVLKDLGLVYQATPHSKGNVYSFKNGICRGDVFIEKSGKVYDARLASFYDGQPDNEWLRTMSTVDELKLFYQHALNIIIP